MIRFYLKNLFLFTPPTINALVYTNLFINGKPYLYIYWQIAHAFKVRIKGYRTFYSPESTVVFKIPNHMTHIELTCSNIWKKRKAILPLLKISMEASALSNIMTDNFKPKRKTTLKGIRVSAVKLPEYAGRIPACRLHIPNVSITYPFLLLKQHPYE